MPIRAVVRNYLRTLSIPEMRVELLIASERDKHERAGYIEEFIGEEEFMCEVEADYARQAASEGLCHVA